MTRMSLTPTAMVPDNTPLNLTSLVTSIGANTGVSFNNTGRELLVVTLSSTATSATVNVGATVLGQSVTPYTVTLPVSATSVLGPFHSSIDQPGGSLVYIDFSQETGVQVGLAQFVGTY